MRLRTLERPLHKWKSGRLRTRAHRDDIKLRHACHFVDRRDDPQGPALPHGTYSRSSFRSATSSLWLRNRNVRIDGSEAGLRSYPDRGPSQRMARHAHARQMERTNDAKNGNEKATVDPSGHAHGDGHG